ncbi:MAG: hypothetical protein O2973_11035, partial [Gemmatimonadetes bacterium]|nr:hypothetical protein [Gemmatimonadota bacterium]
LLRRKSVSYVPGRSVTHLPGCSLNVYDTRRGSNYSIDQVSRFLDRGVRAGMERVVVEAVTSTEEPEPGTEPIIDLRARARGLFGA